MFPTIGEELPAHSRLGGDIVGIVLVGRSRSPALSALVEHLRAVGHQVREMTESAAKGPDGTVSGDGVVFGVAVALLDAPTESTGAGGVARSLRVVGGVPVLLMKSAQSPARCDLVGPGIEWLDENSPLEEQCAVVASYLQQTTPLLQVGDLCLDVNRGTLLYRQQAVHLTPTEFRVVHTLMRQPGTMLDHSTLETLSDCQNVETHLRSIRHKFSECQASLLLRGTRSLGYTIDARRFRRFSRNPGLALKYTLLQLF
jgi:DNA-binding response OmpR family regulator